jgi:hypothetical protein
MTVFTCGEKASETGEGTTGASTSGASTSEVSASGASTDELPTGTLSESAGATEAPTTGPGTGMTGTSGGESTGGDSTGMGESTGGESSAGETGTTGDVVVLDAALNDACAPDDGPAVALRPGLIEPVCEADWSDESLRIVIFMAAPLGPGVYQLGEGLGFATRQGKNDPDFVSGTEGSVTIESWDGAAVVGSYSVTFMDASVREGGFSGPYCDDDILCG